MFLNTKYVTGQAVTYQTLYTPAAFDAKTVNTALPAGNIVANASVSNGVAGYNIPIQLPAGTNGVNPQLSISYQSQGGDGLLGYGWTLGGLSMITRTTKSIYHDGVVNSTQLDATDRFAIDGTRLIASSGTYGANGTVYTKEMDDFSKVTSFGITTSGPTYFIAETKEGVEYYYGYTADSRFMNATNTGVLFWRLNKVRYKDGNYIDYIYETIDGESRIKEIKYTGNDLVVPDPLFPNITLLPYNSIQFQYNTRATDTKFKINTYEFDSNVKLNSVLTKITLISDTETFKSYEFNYANNSTNVYLNEVIEKGSDGVALNSTVFQYGAQPIPATKNFLGFATTLPSDMISGDFNGDGYSDICIAERSIYNGKAFHTKFTVYTKSPNPNNENFFLQYVETLPLRGVILEKGSSYNFFVGDFNGDGADDIAYALFNVADVTAFMQVKIYYSVVSSTNPNSISYSNQNISIPNMDTGTETFFYRVDWNAKRDFFTVADLNGDGIKDLLMMLDEQKTITAGGATFTTKPFVWYGGSNNLLFSSLAMTPSWAGDPFWIKKLRSIDFDGDGRDEVMLTKGSFSEIFRITGTNSQSIKIAGFPTEWHLIFQGDFNGDRKTDLLTRGSLNNNSTPWNIALSTGKNWIETLFLWNGFTPQLDENYAGFKVFVADVNSDSKSDIVEAFNTGGITSTVKQFLSFGNGIFNFNSTSSSGLAMTSIGNVVGDFNGDGRTDFINRPDFVANSDVFYLHKNGKENIIEKIKNGENHVITFGYQRMSEVGSHYVRSSVTAYPFNSLYLPIYLVTSLQKEGLSPTYYQYKDAILHRGGRGFLGYKQVTEYNTVKYMYQDYKYNLNTNFAIMSLDSIINRKQLVRINKKSISNTYTQVNTGSLERIIWPKVPQVIDDNIIEGTLKETNNVLYDPDGNVTDTNIKFYKKGSPNVLVEQVSTQSTYVMKGSFRPNLPDLITNTTTRTGEVAYTTSVKHYYNLKGQITSKIDFYLLPKALTHTYEYNDKGNQYKLTLSTATQLDRSTTNTFDPKGRYIISSINALGQTSSTTYIQKWAKPDESIGVDGIKTKYTYDNFGRLTNTTYKKGLLEEYTTSLTYGWSLSNASTYILLGHPGRPDVKTYYDKLGRDIIKETEGFNGFWTTTKMSYDVLGNKSTETGPHRTALSETGMVTTFGYDDFNRLGSVSNLLRTINYTYSFTGGESKITKTLVIPTPGVNQVSHAITDVTGKTISALDNGGTLSYTYYSNGQMKSVLSGSVIYTTNEYDVYGRQSKLTDINAGVTTYEYNAFGELFKENNPALSNVTYTYNKIGQITSRIAAEGTTTYLYNTNAGVKINKLDKITSFGVNNEEIFVYDAVYGKNTSTTRKIDNVPFTTSYTYNKYNDQLTTTYPSGVVVTNNFDANGYVTSIANGATTLFTTQEMSPYNDYKKYTYGNGLITDITYNQTFPTRFFSRNSAGTTVRQDLNQVWEYQTGNLKSRNDIVKTKVETFGFDNLNRLTSGIVTGGISYTYNFSANGNITNKPDATVATSNGMEYLLPKINAISKVSSVYAISIDQQNITYSTYQRPLTITESGKSIEFLYGADYNRSRSTFKTGTTTTETRWYLGNYEKQIKGSTTRDIHYITNGERLISIIVKDGTTVTNYYVHTDHLGSILAVTDASAAYVAQQNYDAWGRKRNTTDWTYNAVQTVPDWLYRGFTGHEEYPSFNLINMNARLYDHINGRMLSPDNAVTMPYSTQGYNRYSYANNNPLSYTDPDGNEPVTAILIAVAISVTVNGINNVINDRNFFNGWFQAAFIGAVSGGISSGIGTIAQGLAEAGLSKVSVVLVQSVMHGFTSGMFSKIQGGSFQSGFASGMFSSLTSSSVQAISGSDAAVIIGGTLSGGVGAAVTGGNIAQGMLYGLISSSLNHVAHEGGSAQAKKNASRAMEIAEYEKNDSDNSYNFFYSDDDEALRFGAEYLNDGGANNTTIAINSHGNKNIITSPYGNMNPKQLHDFLYEYNDLYKTSFDTKSSITVHINACNTGNGFAQKLSLINPYINIRAPNTYLMGVYNVFSNGDNSYNSNGKMLWFKNGK